VLPQRRRTAAAFAATSVGKTFVLMAAAAGGYAAARVVTLAVFWTELLAAEILGMLLLGAVTAATLWWAFQRERVLERLGLGRVGPLAATLFALTLSVGTFAALMTVFHEHGQLELRGGRVSDDPATMVGVAADFYVWHVLDSVPLLDIPATIRWKRPFEYSDHLSGWLLLTFKGFVILPLIQVLRLILAGPPKTYERSVLNALRQALPDVNVLERATRAGYARALLSLDAHRLPIGGFAIVDVMRDVWNEDLPIRALAELAERKPHLRPSVYLLVVDAIADAARDQIEKKIERAPFPARLAVWRADAPIAHLAEAVQLVMAELRPSTSPSPSGDNA
jgi:hypothetical protein